MATSYHQRLICGQCNTWYTEPRRLHGSHVFCTACIQQLARNDEGQVQCPRCQVFIKLPDNGVEELILETSLMEMLNDIHCEDCNEHNENTKHCCRCETKVCPRCLSEHSTVDRCTILGLFREVCGMDPSEELRGRIETKVLDWNEVIPLIADTKKNLNHETDELIKKIDRERREKLDGLNELEKTAKDRKEQLTTAAKCREFVQSIRDRIKADQVSVDELRMYQNDVEKMKETLVNIERRLREDSHGAVENTVALTRMVKKMAGLPDTVSDDRQTQTEPNTNNTSIQTERNATDVSTQKTRNYTGMTITRQVDVKDRVPQIKGIFGIASCPCTQQVYVTGLVQGETIVIVHDRDLNHIRQFATGIKTALHSDITVNSQRELMIANSEITDILVVDQHGNQRRRFDTGEKCWGIACDKNDCIYTTHREKQYIAKLNRDGGLQRKIGQGQIGDVNFLTIHTDKLFVSSHSKKSIFVYNLDGELVTQVDRNSDRNQNGSGVCVDDDDEVLWCDHDQHCIHVYTVNGDYLTTIHDNTGSIKQPCAITRLPSGQIAVASKENCKIIVY